MLSVLRFFLRFLVSYSLGAFAAAIVVHMIFSIPPMVSVVLAPLLISGGVCLGGRLAGGCGGYGWAVLGAFLGELAFFALEVAGGDFIDTGDDITDIAIAFQLPLLLSFFLCELSNLIKRSDEKDPKSQEESAESD